MLLRNHTEAQYRRPMWLRRSSVSVGVLATVFLTCIATSAAAAPATRDANPLGSNKGTFDVEVVSGQQRFERTFTNECGASSGVVEINFRKGRLSSMRLIGGVPAKTGPWPWLAAGGLGGYIPIDAKIVARGEHWITAGDGSCQHVTCAYNQDFTPKQASYAVNFNSQVPQMTEDGFALIGLFYGMKLGPGCDPWDLGLVVQSTGVQGESSGSTSNVATCAEAKVWCAPLPASKLAKIGKGKSISVTLERIQQVETGSEETITRSATWKVRITRRA